MQFNKSVANEQSFNIFFESKSYDYSAFNNYIETIAEQLQILNPQKGQFLIFRNSNHILHLALFLLCEKYGLVFIPIFEGTSDSEFQTLVRKLQPDLLVTKISSSDSFKFEKNELAPKRFAKSGCLFQTSGTTGVPGFVFQSFQNLFQNSQLAARGQKITKKSVVLSSLPFSHVGGLCMQTTAALVTGCKLIIVQKNQTEIFIDALKNSTHAVIVPSYFRILSEIKSFHESSFENQPLVITGSTPVTIHLLKQMVAKKFRTQCVYGLTEIGPYVCVEEYESNTEMHNLETQDIETTLLGKALPEYRIRTNSQTAEIEISGPCIGEIYDPIHHTYNKLVESDHFISTGDLGEIRYDKLYFKGRRKIFISVGGLKVNPQEVEEKIIEFGQVKACAVIGVKNFLLGEIPIAYIVSSAEIKKDLLVYLKKNLSRHKIPQKFYFVEALPFTSIGKNNRPEITKKRPVNKYLKFFISAVIVIAALEIISRQLLDLMPFESHRRYATRIHQNGEVEPVTNGRGARGEWPQKQALQVAMIGSSILGDYNVPSKKTWPELLKKNFQIPLHIDNYAVGYTKFGTASEILQSIKANNLHYDIILIQLAADSLNVQRFNYLSQTFMSRWVIRPDENCAFCALSIKFIQRQQSRDKFLNFSVEKINSWLPFKSETPRPNYFDLKWYQKMKKESKFVTGDTNIAEPIKTIANDLVPKVFDLAKSITPHVIWVPEDIGFHPQMKESYKDKFTNLIPIDYKTNEYFYSEESRAEIFNKLNQLVRNHAHNMKIDEMDWAKPIQALLPTEEGLYADEYHLTEKGHEKVAHIMGPQFSKYLVEKSLKIENK